MAVNQTSTVVGVFRDRTQADRAMDALNNAGFDRSQIQFAGPGTKGNFFEDIKSLFVGQSTSGNDITNNLTNMGLSNEEAQYYSNEYNNGNTIVTVQAPDREQEAANVLHSYNAYTYQDNAASVGPANYTQQPAYTEQSGYNTTNQEAPVQSSQPQYQTGGQSSDVDVHDQPTVITNTNYRPYETTEPGPAVEPQPDVATNDRDYATTNQDNPATESQSDVATNDRDTEFQNLQAQIQAVQQQLQDARAQLQSAKEHEAQVKSAREERERRLNDTKQQLQNLQSELQNTLAELRDTQSRVSQYQ